MSPSTLRTAFPMIADVQGTSRSDARFRPEIQGLRALAVLSVLVYHIWPQVLPGGYVGVDVFFVISGYLISGLLLREVEASGRIDVARFYGRRIRRLLPAATVLLLAVAACLPLLPSVRWQDSVHEITASALSLQNWWLATQAVDYLAANNAAGPLQHFWSLSVEEQYYVLWPLLFLCITWLPGAATGTRRKQFGWLIVAIGVSSLVCSVYLTWTNPGLAYFATTTRAWELALGGALALGEPHLSGIGDRSRILLGWSGLLGILGACVGFDSSTEFPGYAALLPTLAAAMIIAAGPAVRWSVARVLSLRPMQSLGDVSYSLYLWHWPIIVFYGLFAGRQLNLPDGFAVASMSLVLAYASKFGIEDAFRARRSGSLLQPFAFASTCIFATVALAQVSLLAANNWQRSISQASGSSAAIRPALADARNDIPDVYASGCHVGIGVAEPKACTWGREEAPVRIVLVGDSHAAQWVPALEEIVARRPDWQVTSFTKSGCPFADVMVSHNKGRRYVACAEWNRSVRARIVELAPSFVLTTQTVTQFAYGAADKAESRILLEEGLRSSWRPLLAAGIPIVAIRDTPIMPVDVPDCLASPTGSLALCGGVRAKALSDADPLLRAVDGLIGAALIDLSDDICVADLCPPVIDGVLVWRDALHLTATYARGLAPALERNLQEAMIRLREQAPPGDGPA